MRALRPAVNAVMYLAGVSHSASVAVAVCHARGGHTCRQARADAASAGRVGVVVIHPRFAGRCADVTLYLTRGVFFTPEPEDGLARAYDAVTVTLLAGWLEPGGVATATFNAIDFGRVRGGVVAALVADLQRLVETPGGVRQWFL